jgi:glycerophosphoryl diester phosphodiesterase
VQQRLPSLLVPPWLFGHRGARAHAAENTLASFELAARLGATGIESDVWITRDGVLVLHHDGSLGRRPRRRQITELTIAQLPPEVPRLTELIHLAEQHSLALSLDVKDIGAIDALSDLLSARSLEFRQRAYVCIERFEELPAIARRYPQLALVDSSRLARIAEGPERRLARLSELGVRALNMHHSDWNGGLVALAHRFDRFAFGWDAQFDHVIASLLRMGVDAVYSDWPDRLIDAARLEKIV